MIREYLTDGTHVSESYERRIDETDFDEIADQQRQMEAEREAELADEQDGYDPAEPWMDRD